MFARNGPFSSVGRCAGMAVVSAVVLTSLGPAPAWAGSAASGKAQAANSGATDFSARRRVYRGDGGAAAAAAFAGIVGTGIAIAAAQNRRAYYDDYYGGPVYYGGGPFYYGDGPYYGYGGYRSGVPTFKGHPLANW